MGDSERLILARDLVTQALPEGAEYRVVGEMKGRDLIGKR